MSRDEESYPRPEGETRDRSETASAPGAAGPGAVAPKSTSSAAAEATDPASAGPAGGVVESGAGSAVGSAVEPGGESGGEPAVGRRAVESDGESGGQPGGQSGGQSGGRSGGESGGETAVGLAAEFLPGPATARGAQAEWEDEDEWEDEAEWEGREFGGGGLLPPVAAHDADVRSAALSPPTALGGTALRAGTSATAGSAWALGSAGSAGDRRAAGPTAGAGDAETDGAAGSAGGAGIAGAGSAHAGSADRAGEGGEGGEGGGHAGEGDGASNLGSDLEGVRAGGGSGGGGDASDGGGADEADGAEVGESGAGRRRVLRWSRSPAAVLVGVLIGLLGFGLAVQVRSNTSTSGLPAARQEDLVRILDDLSSREDRLRRQIAELEAARARLSSAGDTSSTALQEARKRSEALGILAGTVAAQGPGVVLTITDPNHRLAAEDLLDTVEELRAAGAEAIQVGGVRIGLDSSFTAADTGIAVDGVAVTVPYTILAIGDPPTLATAMGIPGGVADTAKRAGGEARTEQRQQVVIRALRPVKTPHYSRPTN